jgi:hypothetical protein
MYEKRRERLLSRRAFLARLARHGVIAALVVAVSLGIGILGYHSLENLAWIDALVNASMILGGMGPVNEIHTFGGKLFASFYALFTGVVFLILMGIMAAPILHRFLHRFHVE